jgi:hypothetical protein
MKCKKASGIPPAGRGHSSPKKGKIKDSVAKKKVSTSSGSRAPNPEAGGRIHLNIKKY